jgi:hypothetical protein
VSIRIRVSAFKRRRTAVGDVGILVLAFELNEVLEDGGLDEVTVELIEGEHSTLDTVSRERTSATPLTLRLPVVSLSVSMIAMRK